jgi:hypothetical protein
MEMREFGAVGMRASVIGLGCNNFGIYQDAKQAIAVVHKAAIGGRPAGPHAASRRLCGLSVWSFA